MFDSSNRTYSRKRLPDCRRRTIVSHRSHRGGTRIAALLFVASVSLTACSSNSSDSGTTSVAATGTTPAAASSAGTSSATAAESSAAGSAGGSETSMASSGTVTAPATPYRVIFIAALLNDSFFVTVRCGAQDQAKALGVDLKFEGPTT